MDYEFEQEKSNELCEHCGNNPCLEYKICKLLNKKIDGIPESISNLIYY